MISPPAWLRGRRHQWIATGALVAVAIWYWLQFFTRATNLLDEGSTAAQAMRVLHGDLIYRDFFTVVTPGSYYTVAWLFTLFGLKLVVLRWAALVTGIGILLATLFVTRRLASWPFAAAAALMTTVWGWFLVTPNFYSLEASLLSLIALAIYVSGAPSWRRLIASGIAVGLAALVKQNVGAYMAMALLLTIWASRLFDDRWDVRGRIKSSAQLIGGICIPVLPVIAWLVIAGAGPYLYESWVYYPLAKYPQRFALPYPPFPVMSDLLGALTGRIGEPQRYDIWTGLVLHLPTLLYPAAVVLLGTDSWRRYYGKLDLAGKREAHAALAVTFGGIFSLLTAWPRADITHILFGIQPTFALLAYLLSRVARAVPSTARSIATPSTATTNPVPGTGSSPVPGTGSNPVPGTGSAILTTVVAVVPMLGLLWVGYQRTWWEYQNYVAGLHVERGRGISAQLLEAQRIDTVTKYIVDHTAPNEPIFVVPWAAGFYFLADRPNATRTDFMLFEDPELYPCLITRLDQQAPRYIIYGYTWDVDEKKFRDYAAPVDQYIRSHYAVEFTTDGYEIWRRREDAPPQAAGTFPRACQPRKFRMDDLF